MMTKSIYPIPRGGISKQMLYRHVKRVNGNLKKGESWYRTKSIEDATPEGKKVMSVQRTNRLPLHY